MKKLISTILFISLATSLIFAQHPHERRSKVDWDKYKSQKISFITERLDLDTKTAAKFWPEYNKFEKELIETMRSRRSWDNELKQDLEGLSNKELTKLSWRMTELAEKEVEVRKASNEKFLEILTPKQVVLLYQAEQEFRAHLLSTYGKKMKEEKGMQNKNKTE